MVSYSRLIHSRGFEISLQSTELLLFIFFLFSTYSRERGIHLPGPSFKSGGGMVRPLYGFGNIKFTDFDIAKFCLIAPEPAVLTERNQS